jgi:hypothetical protein
LKGRNKNTKAKQGKIKIKIKCTYRHAWPIRLLPGAAASVSLAVRRGLPLPAAAEACLLLAFVRATAAEKKLFLQQLVQARTHPAATERGCRNSSKAVRQQLQAVASDTAPFALLLQQQHHSHTRTPRQKAATAKALFTSLAGG